MDERYQPAELESRVQRAWAEQRLFKATEDPSRPKFYCLCMFPYPSGRLHMGHVRNYTIGDVVSRYLRMRGYNVLQPMGWDAFGLPAENAAIQNRVPPARWTYDNIAYMRGQLQRLGYAYDWDRELATCRPEYYRWEQWLFTRLFKKGLAYKRKAEVNWDPVDQTVLANEQVVDGRGWRSGALIERREIPQWFLKITDYADELLNEIDRLEGWPEAVRTMQRNWIGRSEGVEVDFALADRPGAVRVYTTRPDTLFGATFMALAANHPLTLEVAKSDPAVAAFVAECQHGGTSQVTLETTEKRGVALGLDAVNPLSGERISIWAANFVLMSYGTGAIMSVPGHDERDHEFAVKYGLPITRVIRPADGTTIDVLAAAYTEYGIVCNSGRFDGMDYTQAFAATAAELEARGIGSRKVNYRLRDWLVSRQRYWGCPVPIIHCEQCGEVPVPDADLPVVLPEDLAVDGGGSPLAKLEAFVFTHCPQCARPARRETDTFDTFVDSSWYFARFTCTDNQHSMLDERARYWLPVDLYIGGIEHAILHLLYSRFYQKLLRDEGLSSIGEPFVNLLTQGMVLAETFLREGAAGEKIYFAPNEVDVDHDDKGKIVAARARADGAPVLLGGVQSMSKSKRNGVDPGDLIDRYGADTVRLYTMFASPPELTLEWRDSAVEGQYRFLRRIWRLVHEHLGRGAAPALDAVALSPPQRALRHKVHETIAKVSDDIGRRHRFNTAIAAVMELVNAIGDAPAETSTDRALRQEALEAVVLLLAPIVPHITDELWRALGHHEPVATARWPEVDATARLRDTLTLIVQVNGKKRTSLDIPAEANQDEIRTQALADPAILRHLEGKAVRNVIVVPGRLVNIVAG